MALTATTTLRQDERRQTSPDTVRVLLHDRRRLLGEAVAACLRADPVIDVVAVTDTFDAVAFLAKQLRPDVVILSGHELDGGELPVRDCGVVVLGSPSERSRELIDCGARGYVATDAPVRDLASAVKAVAEGRVFGDQPRPLAKRVTAAEARAAVTALTAREAEVLRLLATGASNAEIAKTLRIARNTVRTHVQNIRMKLHARSRLELLTMALRGEVSGHKGVAYG